MKFKGFILVLLAIFTFMCLTNELEAQSKGRVTGRVSDASSGDYLPGANVMIVGTNFGSATDRAGVYRIDNVPPGTFTLKVSYIGYQDFSTQITVVAGATVEKDATLKVSYVEMDELVVEGLRQGQIKALSQQRTATNIKTVVAREQMEQFPDYNTADVLQRIPGITIGRDQGEGRYVLIRGTEPRLTTITVNGEQLSTTRGDERVLSLDFIGSNQMASIEVVKALTPDMDGDAIGGTVNLVTRSAFDFDNRHMKLTLGGGYGDLRGNPLYQGKFNYSDRFGSKKNFGFNITANWDRSDRGADGEESVWEDRKDVNGNTIPFALRETDLRDYYVVRDRIGLGGGLEYRLSEGHRFYVRGMWNKFNDDETRGRWRVRVDRGKYLDAFNTTDSRFVRMSKNRLEENLLSQYAAGGSHQIGDMNLDYNVAYNQSFERKDPQIESTWDFDKKANLTLDLDDPDYIKWDITNFDDELQYDPKLYIFNNIDYREENTEATEVIGSLNLKIPTTIAGLPTEVKLGGKARMKDKDRNLDRWAYKWEGSDKINMEEFVGEYDNREFLNDTYRFGPFPDGDKLRDFFDANKGGLLQGDMDYWDSEGQTYHAKEKIFSGYAMATTNVGRFMLLGGFRNELTYLDYTGTELMFDANGDYLSHSPVEQKKSYGHLLPMFHVRYRLSAMSNLRAAITRTISRPNYFNVAPYFYVDPDGEEIRKGNPDLNATSSWNADLMGEHYFQGVGILSGGLFYKDLKDIIFTSVYNQVGGVYDGYEVEQPINGGDAELFGLEINWQQQFTFLPGFLSGFGIYANYTHTWAKTGISEREDILPGQSGDVANLALTYEKYGFSSRVSLMYQDKYIEEIGANEDFDIYRDEHLQLDISASQKLFAGLEAFLEFVNLTNEPQRNYYGITSRPRQNEYYSWWMRGGFKYTL